MPIITVPENVRNEIRRLGAMPQGVPREIIRVSVNFIRKGSNRRVVEKAAARLNVTPEEVEGSISSTAYFMTECSRVDASDRDVADSVALLSLPPESEAMNSLIEITIAAKQEIRSVLNKISFSLPHYKDLSWRLDVELGSRCLRSQVTPFYLLKLETEGKIAQNNEHSKQKPKRKDGISEEYFEIDPLSLKHVTSELEIALSQAKTAASRRVMRNIR